VTPVADNGAGRIAGLRDIALVARFELGEALRSRLLVVMLLLFVGGGALGAWSFTALLERIEANAAKVVGLDANRRPGKMVRDLSETRSYREMLRLFLGSQEKADYFAAIPPIVVFFGWVAFKATPWLVLFTASETIASDVASRSIRFSVLRTGRLPFALGKMAGQAAIMIGASGLAAVAFYVVAGSTLDGFEHGKTALGLLGTWPRVVLYTLPFLAWAMLASMATASPNMAKGLAIGGAVILSMLHSFTSGPALRRGPISNALCDFAQYVTPFGHHEGLSYPPGGALAGDIAICLALTVLYFTAGFAILRRRDL